MFTPIQPWRIYADILCYAAKNKELPWFNAHQNQRHYVVTDSHLSNFLLLTIAVQ